MAPDLHATCDRRIAEIERAERERDDARREAEHYRKCWEAKCKESEHQYEEEEKLTREVEALRAALPARIEAAARAYCSSLGENPDQAQYWTREPNWRRYENMARFMLDAADAATAPDREDAP